MSTAESMTATETAAYALLRLYGEMNADFIANVLTAGWMTESERKCLAPLATTLRNMAADERDAA